MMLVQKQSRKKPSRCRNTNKQHGTWQKKRGFGRWVVKDSGCPNKIGTKSRGWIRSKELTLGGKRSLALCAKKYLHVKCLELNLLKNTENCSSTDWSEVWKKLAIEFINWCDRAVFWNECWLRCPLKNGSKNTHLFTLEKIKCQLSNICAWEGRVGILDFMLKNARNFWRNLMNSTKWCYGNKLNTHFIIHTMIYSLHTEIWKLKIGANQNEWHGVSKLCTPTFVFLQFANPMHKKNIRS